MTSLDKEFNMKNIMSAFVLAILTVALTPGVKAEPYVGLSAFAAMHPDFPCNTYVDTLVNVHKPAMAVLWGTFGSNKNCMRSFLSSKQYEPHLLQIHLTNQTCYEHEKQGDPNRRCARGELRQGINEFTFNHLLETRDQDLKNRIMQRVRNIITFVRENANANTRVVLSTGLEDRYTDNAYAIITSYIREAGWFGLTVRNPKGTSYRYFDHSNFLELHNVGVNWANSGHMKAAKPGNCIANLDGQSAFHDVDFNTTKAYIGNNSDCYAVFLWNKDLQGGGNTSGLKPRQRTFSLNFWTQIFLNYAMTSWR